MAATSVVTQGVCAGEISGIGKLNGPTLRIEPYVKEEGGEQCVLQVEFSKDWSRARLTEGRGCIVYHGQSCAWEGQQVKRKPK